MIVAVSAGLLMYTVSLGRLKVFLVHPGGPFFKNKDDGYWGIPKGLQEFDEGLLKTAVREFHEETSIIPLGDFFPLGFVKQKNGKIVHAWAFRVEDNFTFNFKSNTFEMEWPPESGIKQLFPEVDKGEFFDPDIARIKIVGSQSEFISKLERHLNLSELI
ncbi:MAG: NUDIX domain-containing protein [Ignavibacteriaceae bacterium]